MVAITGPCMVGLFKTYLMNTSAQMTSNKKIAIHLTELPIQILVASIALIIFLMFH